VYVDVTSVAPIIVGQGSVFSADGSGGRVDVGRWFYCYACFTVLL
jgi:hypothetical protein